MDFELAWALFAGVVGGAGAILIGEAPARWMAWRSRDRRG